MPLKRMRNLMVALLVAGASVVPQAPGVSASPAAINLADQTHPLVNAAFASMADQPVPASLLATTQHPASTPIRLVQTPTSLQREVYGFVNAGNLGDPNVGYTTWNFALLTTVAYFGLQVNSGDGALVQTVCNPTCRPQTGWAVYHSSTMTNFVNRAHSAGVKVVVSLNLHDFSTGPTNQVCQGLQPANAAVTIGQIKSEVAGAGIDGVNVDYEGTDSVCANGLSSRAELDTFVQNLRAAMPTTYLVIDTYSGSAEDNLEFFDIAGLQPNVDAFFVMAYDMDNSNWSEAPLNCTSYCMNPVSPLNTYRFNVTKSMTQYMAYMKPSKIILGQPYYGRRGCVPNLSDAHQYPTPNTNFVSPTYQFASTIPSQTGVVNFAGHRDPGDGVSEWDTWFDQDWNCNREQYFDDVNSLGAKYDLVNVDDLRGVGLFTLDYAGGASEAWNMLAAKFTTTTAWTALGGVLTSSPAASSWGANRIDTFARGLDNQLWHTWWDGTRWNAWQPLGGGLSSDPAVVSWGPNRLDIFARGFDGQLYHTWWDGTAWGAWQPLGGSMTSGPTVASWSSNRLDVFARGADNALWHTWWDGSRWNGWQPLGGVLTSDPEAVAWGLNRLDIFARGLDNAAWHTWWDGARWNSWQTLGGGLTSGPGVSSCAPGHLDLFVVGNDHGLWRRGWNGSQWTLWQPQGGRWTADPAAVCQPAATSADVFERGLDNSLWHTTVTAS